MLNRLCRQHGWVSRSAACLVVLVLAGCSGGGKHLRQQPPLSQPGVVGEPLSGAVPKRLALLLPLKGPQASLGQAIRDGFLSAYYQAIHPGMTVQLYDTEGQASKVPALYEEALAKQAEIIIGPLNKAEVQALANLKPTIPVLALNTVTERPPTKQFYQFGLLPEDEIVRLADLAWGRQFRRIVIFATPNERGKRLTKNFTEQWAAKGGKIVSVVWLQRQGLQEQLADTLAPLKTALEAGSPTTDAFFLATSADIARQIKPLLDFDYLPNTPAFAPASIYSGIPLPLKDQDLNGVEFCDMPWVLDGSDAVIQQRMNAEQQWTKSFRQSPRLFALGIDAFQLVTEWSQFTTGSTRVSGMTGTLSLLPAEQQVQRHLFCSKFVHGQPQAVKEN